MNPRDTRSLPSPTRPAIPATARRAGMAWRIAGVAGLAAAIVLAGCSSPATPRGEEELREAIIESARRELTHPRSQPLPRPTTREETVAALEIDPRFLPELEQMTTYDPMKFDVGPDLLGEAQRTSTVSLERAIRTAITNNLEAQFARLSPAIQESQVVAAEAAAEARRLKASGRAVPVQATAATVPAPTARAVQ